MGETAEKVQRVTLSTLKQRGWTDGAVKQFLGEPDTLAPNPNYRSGPKMGLYNLARVEAAEVSQRWQDWREATKARREKASARQTERMKTARTNLIAELNAVQISVPRLSKDKLWRIADQYPYLAGECARQESDR